MLEFGNILGYIIGVIGTTSTITATIIIYVTGKKVNVEACGLMMSKLEDKIGDKVDKIKEILKDE